MDLVFYRSAHLGADRVRLVGPYLALASLKQLGIGRDPEAMLALRHTRILLGARPIPRLHLPPPLQRGRHASFSSEPLDRRRWRC